jgi:hypothetical protein
MHFVTIGCVYNSLLYRLKAMINAIDGGVVLVLL